MKTNDVRSKFLKYYQDRGHAVIPSAGLVPHEDATTLFIGSGMQPLIPYLLGEPHPAGTRVVNAQACFRAEDIDEIGDNRHTTLFEMLGNWSFGDYFKREQLPWFFEFLTGELGLDPQRIYVSVFAGDPDFNLSEDKESVEIWQKLFGDKGIKADFAHLGSEAEGASRGIKPGERVFGYDVKKNWWSRSGTPREMPVGEPGGPDSEVFYMFPGVQHDPKWGQHCHPNCDCGRFIELGNSVFMQYKKIDNGLQELPKKNVDYGGGLERIVAAVQDTPDIFKIDTYWPIIEKLQDITGYEYDRNQTAMRVIADHVRATVFLAANGVVPSNTEQGYVMRRFFRRAVRQALALDITSGLAEAVAPIVIDLYQDAYPELETQSTEIIDTLTREEVLFRRTLERGVREFERIIATEGAKAGHATLHARPVLATGDKVTTGHITDSTAALTGEAVFKLSDTYGFPSELTLEEAKNRHIPIDPHWKKDFDRLLQEQKDRSRTATTGQFKGGLADHSEITTKYHTATHMMYKALRLVLGDHVVQRGSNITAERLRFDFSHPEKMTPEQIKQVEDIVNQNIKHDWPMGFREIPTEQAFKEGALGAFGDKYGATVKVYTAGDPDGEWYSKEICGGPHVEHTGVLGDGGKQFKITKEESSSAGVRRIKAVLK